MHLADALVIIIIIIAILHQSLAGAIFIVTDDRQWNDFQSVQRSTNCRVREQH